MIKKLLTGLTLSALLFAASPAFALAVDVGNPATDRALLDGYSNFVIVDTNNPVNLDGYLDTFNYYAENQNTFHFLLVDNTNTVKWMSPTITPSAGNGAKVWTPVTPVAVEDGWNLGVHFDSTGTISYDDGGATAIYTANGSGSPTLNSTLTIEGSTNRTYSFNASGSEVVEPPVADHPVTKDDCKNGGWMNFTNPEFKNQGQCIKYVNQQ